MTADKNTTLKTGGEFEYFTNFMPTPAFANDAQRIINEAKTVAASAYTVKNVDVQVIEPIQSGSPFVYNIGIIGTTRQETTLNAIQQSIDACFTKYGTSHGGIREAFKIDPMLMIGGGLLAVLLLKKLMS